MDARSAHLPDPSLQLGSFILTHFDVTSRIQRRERRTALRVALKLFRENGAVEYTSTENISKGGLCFVTGEDYIPGQTLLVELLCGDTGQSIQGRAKVVFCRGEYGDALKTCGAQFLY